jgi:hypothetical protein
MPEKATVMGFKTSARERPVSTSMTGRTPGPLPMLSPPK